MLHVKKHPSLEVLRVARIVEPGTPLPAGWEAMTDAQLAAWDSAELAAGWVPVAPPAPPPVPEAITNAQCRVVLIRQGINPDDVLAYINTAQLPSEAVRQELKARWEYANHINRSDPATIQLGSILGFSAEQMDELFRAAALIP